MLVGDFLFSRAFQLMVMPGSLRVLEILSSASAVIAEGEVLQLITSNDTATTELAYLEVIKGKTAALFSAACEVGAVIADRPKAEQEALSSYGLNLGIAFQLIDDALDYSAKQEALGQDRRRRLPRGQDHPPRHPRLPARRRRGAHLLAAGDGSPGAGSRKTSRKPSA